MIISWNIKRLATKLFDTKKLNAWRVGWYLNEDAHLQKEITTYEIFAYLEHYPFCS